MDSLVMRHLQSCVNKIHRLSSQWAWHICSYHPSQQCIKRAAWKRIEKALNFPTPLTIPTNQKRQCNRPHTMLLHLLPTEDSTSDVEVELGDLHSARLGLQDITGQISRVSELQADLLALLMDAAATLDLVGAVPTALTVGGHDDDLLGREGKDDGE